MKSDLKMKGILILSTALMFQMMTPAHGEIPPGGKIERFIITSSEIRAPRDVSVWLPADYDTTKNYAVIYMHDGQMLFDTAITWNKQEWMADEVASQLMNENKIRPCIIVGVWNRNPYRYEEYFPEKALSFMKERCSAKFLRRSMKSEPLGDAYLRMLVKEIKPYIDSHYSTYTDRENTIVMGSSMGGLISLYAICEYPDVFGGAGCLSTHLPMRGVGFFTRNDNRVAKAFRKYLSLNLPAPENHKIYFDYGTRTLDRWYEPYQKKVDKVMSSAGFNSENWITVKYEGHDHSEKSWSSRLHVPMEFLSGSRE